MAASRSTSCVAYFAIDFQVGEERLRDVTFGSERTCAFSMAQAEFAALTQPALDGAAADAEATTRQRG